MTDRVLVPLATGQWLALSPETFTAGLKAGAEVFGGQPQGAAAAEEPALDAEQLAAALSLPVTWIEQAAREQRIPSIQAGRWRRFKRSAVEVALSKNGGAA